MTKEIVDAESKLETNKKTKLAQDEVSISCKIWKYFN